MIDTNLYIEAARSRAAQRALREFARPKSARVMMLSVVAQELQMGAQTRERRGELAKTLASFEAEGHLLTVSYAAERQAGRVLADLAAAEQFDLAHLTASFLNDVRIAAACREHGALLVTRNVGDFAAIARHLAGFRFVPPWP